MPTIPGPFELVIILVIVVMIFGVGKLPEVGGAVGKTIREFRRNMDNEKKEIVEETQEPAQEEKPQGDAA